MFITFTHAISKTRITAASIAQTLCLNPMKVNAFNSGITLADVKFWFVFGLSSAMCLASAINSAFTWSSVTPDLSRPITAGALLLAPSRKSPRGCGGNSLYRGVHSSSENGNLKPGGMTPMMVAALPFTRTLWPMMFGLAAKSRRQISSPRINVFSAPGLLSSAVKSRPRTGDTPTILKRSSLT